MVLLLNYINVIILLLIVLVGLFLYKKKAALYASWAILVVFWIVFKAANPSYIPKTDTGKLPIPAFEQSDAVIEDRSLKPMDPKLRKQEFEKQFDWQQELGASSPTK